MFFGKIKNNFLYELKNNINELKNVAWRLILYSELAAYGVELPKESDELIQLKELDLSEKGIDVLPTGIGHLTRLTKLTLTGNQLTKLPKQIGNLTQLTELDLSFNNLTSLPKQIGNLTQLTELNLSNNHLTSLPKEIENLTRLSLLNIDLNIIRNTDLVSRIQSRCKFNKDNEVSEVTGLDEIATLMLASQRKRLLSELKEA